MNKEKRLLKNTIIYFLGNFGSKFLGIIILPLYTHYLSTNQFGYYDLISTYITLLVPIITLQISDALYKYMLESKNCLENATIITNSLFIILMNLGLANTIILIISQFIYLDYMYLFLLQLNVTVIYTVWLQIARGYKNSLLYSLAGLIFTVMSLLSTIITIVVYGLGVRGLIISNIIGAVSGFLVIELKLKAFKQFKVSLTNKRLKYQLVKFSLPLMPKMISWWVMNALDRTIINFYIGSSANGLYAIANKFPSMILLLNSVFSLAWQESVIVGRNSEESNKFYSKMFNLYVIIQFTGVLVILSLTKILMRFFVSDEFFTAWKYTPFLYLATIFSGFSSFYGASYLSSGKTIGSFYTSILGAMINFIGNLLFIPIIGLQGAAVSTFFSFLIMWLARLVNTRKDFKIEIDKKNFLTLSSIMGMFIYLFYIDNVIIEIITMLLSIIIFYIYNRNLIIAGKNILIKKFLKRKSQI